MSAPARPWRVIITRPAASGATLGEVLQQAGFAVIHAPLLAIAPVAELESQRQIQTLVMDLDHYDAVFFVSINAVHEAFAWIDRYWPQLPTGIRFYAVGASSARVLDDYGVSVCARARIDAGAMTSEALLADASLQALEHQRFLIFRGRGGREHMAQTLRARGAQVDIAELYTRCLPSDAQSLWRELLADKSQWNSHYTVIALHSGESLQHWRELIATLSGDAAAHLAIPILLPSARLCELAQQLGFTQIMSAENATDVAMLNALNRARATSTD